MYKARISWKVFHFLTPLHLWRGEPSLEALHETGARIYFSHPYCIAGINYWLPPLKIIFPYARNAKCKLPIRRLNFRYMDRTFTPGWWKINKEQFSCFHLILVCLVMGILCASMFCGRIVRSCILRSASVDRWGISCLKVQWAAYWLIDKAIDKEYKGKMELSILMEAGGFEPVK